METMQNFLAELYSEIDQTGAKGLSNQEPINPNQQSIAVCQA